MSRDYGWRASCPAGGVTDVVVGSSAWFASDVWADWVVWGLGFIFRKLRSIAYRYGIPAITSFWVLDFILPGFAFPAIGILSDGALQFKISMWRTLKVSHECRWRDLLRQQEA